MSILSDFSGVPKVSGAQWFWGQYRRAPWVYRMFQTILGALQSASEAFQGFSRDLKGALKGFRDVSRGFKVSGAVQKISVTGQGLQEALGTFQCFSRDCKGVPASFRGVPSDCSSLAGDSRVFHPLHERIIGFQGVSKVFQWTSEAFKG